MTQPNTSTHPADPTTTQPAPAWLPLAADLITRLRLYHGHQSQKIASAIDRGAFDEDAEEDDTLRSVFDRFQADQAGTEAHVSEPVIPIPPRQLLTAIRLAVAFQTKAALAATKENRALTILMDIDAQDVDLTSEVLKSAFHHYAWVQLSPSITDGTVSKAQADRFWASVATAMDAYVPTLLVVPAGLTMPAYLQHAGLPTYRLPSISAEIILAHLRAGELGDAITDESTFRQALPSDTLLATLSTAEACTTLRAPSIPDVLARLAAMTRTEQTNAPRLEDMTGDSPALLAARRLIADLQLWKAGHVAWSDLSRSILFYGPPGTGKTWLARAMGASAGIACVTGSFAEWQAAGHLGDMLREMRKTFAAARQQTPCILFIDEIDAVGSRASKDNHNSNYRTQVINGFLGEMNSIALEEGVIVVGACNHIDRMDAAILRAGRFDIKVEVPLPGADQILSLLLRHLGDEIPDVDLTALARAAVGLSPAAIDAAIRAARSDARHAQSAITPALLRQHLNITPDTTNPNLLWRMALHEAGHAVVGAALGLGAINSMKITAQGGEIRRRIVPTELLLSDIEALICYDLAGRAAERLVLGTISAGAGGPEQSDLAIATDRALKIETTYGLGVDGPVWLDAPGTLLLQNNHLRGRVRQRLDRAELRAGKILAQHRKTLEALAEALLAERSLNAAQITTYLEITTRAVTAAHQDQSTDNPEQSGGLRANR